MNLTTEVVYKRGQDYRFVCYDQGHACQSYRVRFLCGRPGKQLRVGTAGLLGPVPGAGGCSSPVWMVGSTASKHLSDTELPPSWRWRALHDTGSSRRVLGASRGGGAWSTQARVQGTEPTFPQPSLQGHSSPPLWVLLFQTRFPRCSLEVGSGRVGVFVEALGHGQKAPIGDGSSWGRGHSYCTCQ